MRIRSACAIVALALGATVLGAGTADATGPLSGTKVRNWQSGFVLGVAGNSTVGGEGIQYQTDTNDLAQKWAIDPVTTTTFLLRNLNSDMCITAVNSNGDALQQRPCDPRWSEQIFSLLDSSKPNRYLLKNQDRGTCMNPANVSVGAYAVLVDCAANVGHGYTQHSFDVR
ncbi:RICIN domain-containing protein [Kitasatospora sp. HPMI-4]|uniref:RICIN domain-containing protein n=1 Tax=Kitasatospora sp. HPMI-4 TaxID=3448443 RepID=UPI003F1BC77C